VTLAGWRSAWHAWEVAFIISCAKKDISTDLFNAHNLDHHRRFFRFSGWRFWLADLILFFGHLGADVILLCGFVQRIAAPQPFCRNHVKTTESGAPGFSDAELSITFKR
jgi:hypothetical protein